jgi:hypothetical protein
LGRGIRGAMFWSIGGIKKTEEGDTLPGRKTN